MKYLSILMLVVFLASLIGIAYLYLTANITVTATGTAVTEASEQPEQFAELQNQVKNGTVIGTAYTTQVPEDAAQYKFVTYRVQLRNSCLLNAEMVELQVTPREEDVLQIGSTVVRSLNAGKEAVFEATVLTGINSYNSREINITYYLWGQPFTLRTTCGGS